MKLAHKDCFQYINRASFPRIIASYICEVTGNLTKDAEIDGYPVTGIDFQGDQAGTSRYGLTGCQFDTECRQLVGEPSERLTWITEHVGPNPLAFKMITDAADHTM